MTRFFRHHWVGLLALIFGLGAFVLALTPPSLQTSLEVVRQVCEEGAPGEQGPQGEQGEPGAPGVCGPAGEAGEVGPEGPQGARGATGSAGAQGEQGDIGPAGPQGIQGEVGARGPTGLKGLRVPRQLRLVTPWAVEQSAVLSPRSRETLGFTVPQSEMVTLFLSVSASTSTTLRILEQGSTTSPCPTRQSMTRNFGVATSSMTARIITTCSPAV